MLAYPSILEEAKKIFDELYNFSKLYNFNSMNETYLKQI